MISSWENILTHSPETGKECKEALILLDFIKKLHPWDMQNFIQYFYISDDSGDEEIYYNPFSFESWIHYCTVAMRRDFKFFPAM